MKWIVYSFGTAVCCLLLTCGASRASCLPFDADDLRPLDEATEAHPREVAADVARRLAIKEPGRTPLRAAQLDAILADALAEQSRIDEALRAVDSGLEALRRAAASEALDRTAIRLGLLRAQLSIDRSDSARAVASVDRLLEGIARYSREFACALSVRAMAYQYLNQPDKAAADALSAYRLAVMNGWAGARQETAYTLAGLFAGAGIDQQAHAMLDVVSDSASKLHETSLMSTVEYQRATLFIHAHRYAEALGALDRSIADARADGDLFSVAAANVLRCWALINQRELAAAETVCHSGAEDLTAGQREDMLALQQFYQARLALDQGRPQAALALLDAVLASDVHKLLPRQEAQIYRDRGRANAALRRYRNATADLTRAADVESADGTDARSRQVAVMGGIVASERLAAANDLLTQRMAHERADLARQRKSRLQWMAAAGAAALLCAALAGMLVVGRRRTRQLRRYEIIIRSASSRAPDTILLLDEARVVRFANRNIVGAAEKHPIGEPVGVGVPAVVLRDVRAAIEQSFATREVVNFSADTGDDADGKRCFQMCVLPAVDGADVLGVTLRSTEVTETRALEREVLDGAALERQRLSSELHEGLGQQLAGVLMMLGSLATRIRRGLPGADRLADEIANYVVQSIESTQHLARGLAPVRIGSGSLSEALRVLVDDTNRRSHVRVSCECNLADCSISDLAADHLYRICHEAIANPAVHGRCTRVDLRLRCIDDAVVLTIGDDGAGPQSVGIRMMAYRARALGGSMNSYASAQGGTLISVRVPLARVRANQAA